MARTLKGPQPKQKGMSLWFKIFIVALICFCGYKFVAQEIKIYQIKQDRLQHKNVWKSLKRKRLSWKQNVDVLMIQNTLNV